MRTTHDNRPESPRQRTSGKARSVIDYLAATETFGRLADQANRLRQLQSVLEANLPAHLQPGTRVANLKRGKLFIHTDSGAVAVKLRQMVPRLTECLAQQAGELTGIEIRVQAWRAQRPATGKTQPITLGQNQKQVLTSLAAGLNLESPLKRALDKLLHNAS